MESWKQSPHGSIAQAKQHLKVSPAVQYLKSHCGGHAIVLAGSVPLACGQPRRAECLVLTEAIGTFDVMRRRSTLDCSGRGRHAGSFCELLPWLMPPRSLHLNAACLISIFGSMRYCPVRPGHTLKDVWMNAEYSFENAGAPGGL